MSETSAESAGLVSFRAWTREFPATPDQVGAARRYLTALLGGHPVTDDAVTCLSELAANSVTHSRSAGDGGTFTVRLRRSGAAVRLEVTDRGGPWRPGRTTDGQSGRGLSIVRALSDRRGIFDHKSGARTVWIELDPP